MRKIITFLGPSNYSETLYTFNGQSFNSKFCVEAIANYLKPDKVLICVTELVLGHSNYATLKNKLEQLNIQTESIFIPNGQNEVELWTIFQLITEQIKADDVVYFDITNSFRSLPFISFLIIAFLRNARNVQVEKVLYGAFERNKTETPILELTEFVELLDWMNATQHFTQTGNAKQLSDLLHQKSDLGEEIQSVANELQEISLAARFCNPFELGTRYKSFSNAINQLSISNTPELQPFHLVAPQISQSFSEFSLASADILQDAEAHLKQQYSLIEWYFDNQQYMQGYSLAREWLINMVTVSLKSPIDLDRKKRSEFELAISGQTKIDRYDQYLQHEFTVDDLNEFGKKVYAWEKNKRTLLKQTWNLITEPRNAFDHAFHQKHKKNIKIDEIKNLRDKLKEIMAWLELVSDDALPHR